MTILETSIIIAARDHVAADLGAEAVILHLKSGIYYGLNTSGARIWCLIQEPRTVSEIQNLILEEYEVEPERCATDLRALLRQLANEGLVEVKDEMAV